MRVVTAKWDSLLGNDLFEGAVAASVEGLRIIDTVWSLLVFCTVMSDGVKICIEFVWGLLSCSLVDAAVSEERIASVFRVEFYLPDCCDSRIATYRSRINPDTSACEYRIF